METPQSGHFFEVKLENFDGPIDLLLHLVKRQELPIEKLSLFQVSSQYFECLERMRSLDLEVAGEYLVIASTLLSIKSSILLNEPVELVEDESGNLLDPHQLLLDKLREAAVFKEQASKLGERHFLGIDVFPNLVAIEDVPEGPVKYMDHDPMLLARAFKRLLSKADQTTAPLLQISVDSVSIMQRMVGILDRLRSAESPVSFESLVEDLTDRGSIVSGFLALLELCKRGAIKIAQQENFDEITIALSGGPIGDVAASEFDIEGADIEGFDEENKTVSVNE